jgi:GT2 family glycosyltransferase
VSALAIVVPVHNGLEHTRRFLASLEAAKVDALLYVVDDGSTDGTREFLLSRADRVRRIPGDGELWWGGGVNRGCAAAIADGAKLLLLLNNDNVLPPHLVPELLATHAETGGCVSAPVLLSEPDRGGRIVTGGGFIDWRTRGLGLIRRGETYVAEDAVVDVEWLPGAPLLFSADLFSELNGFDERRFPHYRSDADFTLRARRHGRRCVVTWRTWVVNDQTQTGLDFTRRVTPGLFLRGFVSRGSNYNLRQTLAFVRIHCPRRYRLRYLANFYLRYVYASLKTYVPRQPAAGAR